MTKESLMLYFHFNNEEERKNADFYLDMKGIFFHQKIMNSLGFNFEDKKTIEWKQVSDLIKYDKRIRDKLYIYLATLEEYLRAYIGNKYDDNPYQTFWINGKSNRSKVKIKIEKGEKVSAVLESIDFGILISQVKKLPKQDQKELFNETDKLSVNLKAIRELRNAVSHHVFLLMHDFKPCIVSGIEKSTLVHNIKNLRQLLPNKYQYGENGEGGITAEINKCINKLQLDDKNLVNI